MVEPLYEVLARSAFVSVTATLIAAVIGIGLGTALALARLPGRRLMTAVVNTGMALPTVVVGLVVALLLWRSGPLGGLGLIYTVEGMIFAQVLIATPLITGITMAAMQLLPPALPDQLRALGANRAQLVLRMWIEARVPLLAAAMAGFGQAISEVGAATIVGGNIHRHTQVMTTAIVEHVGRGEFAPALFYGAILVTLAFLVNGVLASVQHRGGVVGADLSLRQVRQIRGGCEILRVDDLDVCDGEHVSVLGPNGAGKTTLLRLLAGVDRPASGTVALDGVSTARGGVKLRRQVAYATQQPGLLTTSVRRNVELPLRWRKVPRKERARVATAALERLRVAHLADRRAHELSGGEQQRVNLARALALDPSVLLLDEPAAGLDPQTRSTFFADLEQALADRAATVVQVSHRAEEALRLADRVVVLVDGSVHQVGTPDALTLRPADASVAALVGYDNLVDATVRPDGSVLVGGAPTGLVHRGPVGAATVAVFACGVRLIHADRIGVPVRVTRVTPGPGHRVLALEGAVSLLAQLPIGCPAPLPGDTARVVFESALSAVLPRAAEFPVATPSGSANSLGPITPPAEIAHPVEPTNRQRGGVSTT